jgi:hypothetical protein
MSRGDGYGLPNQRAPTILALLHETFRQTSCSIRTGPGEARGHRSQLIVQPLYSPTQTVPETGLARMWKTR